MGTLAPALQAQAEAVEREQDGVRKALGLHSLLRTLVNHKLDALVTLLSPKSLAAVRAGGKGEALGLHSLLRTLVNHKLDALVTLLSPKSLAAVRGGQGGGEQSLSF